jgi:hypothetical protein
METETTLRELDRIMPCDTTSFVYAIYKQFSGDFRATSSFNPRGFLGKVVNKLSPREVQLIGFQVEDVAGSKIIDRTDDYKIPHYARFKYHDFSGLYILNEKELSNIGVEPIFGGLEILNFAEQNINGGRPFVDLLRESMKELNEYH